MNLKINICETKKLGGQYDESKDEVLQLDFSSWKALDTSINALKLDYSDDMKSGKAIYSDKKYMATNVEQLNKLCVELKDKYHGELQNYAQQLVGINFDDDGYPVEDPVYIMKQTVQSDDKVAVIGDLHSGLHSLWCVLTSLKNDGFFKGDTFNLEDDHHIVFTGDLVDRGPYGVEIISIVFFLKNQNFNNIFVLNGNHEDFNQYKRDGFLYEMEGQLTENVTDTVNRILRFLPSALFLRFGENEKWIQMCHGGIGFTQLWSYFESDDFYEGVTSIEGWLEKVKPFFYQPKDFLDGDNKYEYINDDFVSGFKWMDFGNTYEMTRGTTLQITPDITKQYLDNNNIQFFVRGHQDFHELMLYPKADILADETTRSNIINAELNKRIDYEIEPGYGDIEHIIYSAATPGSHNLKLTDKIKVITTSAAIPTRSPIQNTVHLVLSREGQAGGNLKNDTYYRIKYMKYKSKYLRMKMH
jgi:hypothetical protein